MPQLQVRSRATRRRGRPKGLGSKWAYIINIAVQKIMEEYKDLPLTIRQIFYRLVGKYHLEKKETNYNYLSRLLVFCRKDSWVPWKRIVDLTRKPVKKEWIGEAPTPSTWINSYLKDFLEHIRGYYVPLYANQDYLIEVWSEHEGLRPIFEKALEDKHITLIFTKGYNSWSAFYEAYMRLKDVKDRKIVILHFSDADDPGFTMTKNIQKALTLPEYDKLNPCPLEECGFGLKVEVKRVLLTEEQVKEWGLVDTQLEAIDPSRFIELIRESVKPYIDEERLEETWNKILEGREEVFDWIEEHDIESL